MLSQKETHEGRQLSSFGCTPNLKLCIQRSLHPVHWHRLLVVISLHHCPHALHLPGTPNREPSVTFPCFLNYFDLLSRFWPSSISQPFWEVSDFPPGRTVGQPELLRAILLAASTLLSPYRPMSYNLLCTHPPSTACFLATC